MKRAFVLADEVLLQFRSYAGVYNYHQVAVCVLFRTADLSDGLRSLLIC